MTELRHVQLYTVDRYGWSWRLADPKPAVLRRLLVEAWVQEQATEVRVDVPGRRPVSV